LCIIRLKARQILVKTQLKFIS